MARQPPRCDKHVGYLAGCAVGCQACEVRRIVATHECGDACRREGCSLVHRGYAEARSCGSCGSMGGDCFAGCEQVDANWADYHAELAADRAADAAFLLPDSDTTGPKDPPL